MCGNGSTDKKNSKGKDSVTVKENTVSFSLNKDVMGRDGKPGLTKGNHALVLNNAFIASGSYSGLEIVFQTEKNENDFMRLRFELPSAKTLKISMDKGAIKAEMPVVPFLLTEKDFQGVKNNRYGREQLAFVELSSYKRMPDQKLSSIAIMFTLFNLEIKKADFSKMEFSMECKFTAETDSQLEMLAPPGVKIEGSFRIVKKQCLVKKVD
jgi:hypothetical protein